MSSSSESNNQKDGSDSEDPMVEIPSISGNDLVKRSQITTMDIRGMVVRCTSCLHQINHQEANHIKKHFRLNVIVCKDCYDFYGTSEFSQDEFGNYNYCTWCGNGGKLYLCDFCPHPFCSTCIRRNFGRAEVAKVSKEGWKCYVCDSNKLKAKVAFCQLILDYTNNSMKRKERKTDPESLMLKLVEPLQWAESADWILPAFNDIQDTCKVFHKRINKLKDISTAQSKSVKHVIQTIDSIISKHRNELGQMKRTISTRYIKYLERKKSSKQKSESNLPEEAQTQNDRVKEGSSSPPRVSNIVNGVSKENDVSNSAAKLALLKEDSSESSSSETEQNEVKIKDDSSLSESKVDSDIKPPKANIDSKEDVDVEPMIIDEISTESQDLFEKNSSNDEEWTKDKVKETKPQDFVDKNVTNNSARKIADPVRRKLSFWDEELPNVSGNSSSSSIGFSDSEAQGTKKARRKLTPKKDRSAIRERKEPRKVDVCNDPKLKLDVRVVLTKCDHLVPNGATSVPLPDEYLFREIDKEIESLCKLPVIGKEKKESENESMNTKSKPPANKKNVSAKKPTVKDGSASSSICITSSEDEEKQSDTDQVPKHKKEDPKKAAKVKLLMSDSDDSSSESSLSFGSDIEVCDEIKTKKTLKKATVNSDSSDDFQPKKKKKYDKLLNKRILSDDDSTKDSVKEKKQNEKKKSTKRKLKTSDGEGSKDKQDSDSVHTSTSDSDGDKERKKKKRKRIKKVSDSSSENEDGKEKKASQETPGKGRKNIKKIITKKNLAVETKEAQNIEKERRKRVMERQKQYNIITDKSSDGQMTITRKMVLEVDPTSKEEIVQIDPELCEKLKPHQVKGVRFMWECTIESLKELEKGPGSGCILAHCMGLGKTLQVITFLHTCLTNEHVSKKIQTALVICPYNTILNWAREFEHWQENLDEQVLVHQLTDARDNLERLDILKYWQRDGGVLIASYDVFRGLTTKKKLAKLNKRLKEKLHEILINPGPDIVICDEGHILKNEKSAISKACSQLATERRIVLTGTPLQNNLKEYHCMLSFVKPHLLGTLKEFKNRFVNPIMNGQYGDSTEYDVKKMKKRIHILHKLLEGCVQRCDYSALTKFLPPKHEFVISVKCSEVQIKMYQYYLDNLSQHKADAKIKGGTLFADHNILRNLCTHPYIVHTSYERAEVRRIMNGDTSEEEFINDESEESNKSGAGSSSESGDEVVKTYKTRSRKEESDIEEINNEPALNEKRWYDEFISEEDKTRIELSGKMVLLIDILKECEAIGDKVILFSQSLLTLDIVEEILGYLDEQEVSEEDLKRDVQCKWTKGVDYFRMDGATSAELRKRFIESFNSPSNDRARLFLVSTKAGGLGTNLVGANRVVMLDASWNPSHDVQAIFRVYRFGQNKPVYIYRLLAQGTMEEKIYDRQVNKLSLSIRVVDEQQIDRHFNDAELRELYNFTPDSLSNRPTPMVPKDTLLAELLIKHNSWIVTYHEHDSLLQNQTEEDLTEEERQAAWNEYENEREGRMSQDDNYLIDVENFGMEPDLNNADYVGNMIPSCKDMISNIVSELKKKYPTTNTNMLRKYLRYYLEKLRNNMQAKHSHVLRLKQEFIAKGSVPLSVNKYVGELSTTLMELGKHIDNVIVLIKKDEAEANAKAQAEAQARYVPPVNLQNAGQHRFFPTGGIPRGPIPADYLFRMNNHIQQNINNFKVRFPGMHLPQFQRPPHFTPNARPTYTAPPSNARNPGFQPEPVITEVNDEETARNSPQPANQAPSSTMTIEEID